MGPLALIAALPLLGFLINGVIGPRLPNRAVAAIGCGLPAPAFPLPPALFVEMPSRDAAMSESLYSWVAIPDFAVDVSLYFDALAAVMCLVVTGIGTLIHVYSVGYMAHDNSFA